MGFTDWFCYGLLIILLVMGISYIIIGHINDYLNVKGHGIVLVLTSVTTLIFYSGLKIEDKTIDLYNIKAFFKIAFPAIVVFTVLVIIVWLGFKILYSLLDKLYKKHKKGTTNEMCGWKEYYTLDGVYKFVYWHGDQDGTLYKIIYDKNSIIIKTHISIEKADEMIDCYRKTGMYKEISSKL